MTRQGRPSNRKGTSRSHMANDDRNRRRRRDEATSKNDRGCDFVLIEWSTASRREERIDSSTPTALRPPAQGWLRQQPTLGHDQVRLISTPTGLRQPPHGAQPL